MKIDTHIHITPPDLLRYREKIDEVESYFKWLSASPHNRFVTSEEVVAELNTTGFDQGVVFGFAFKDPALCKYVNDYTIEAIKKYPEKLLGYMVVSPKDRQMAYEIERCVQAGLFGIGELFPEGQGWDLYHAHEQTPLSRCCAIYQLPVLLHANETVGHQYIGKTKVTLDALEAFVRQHTKTPVILAHFGGGLMFFEAMRALKTAYSHVYYDTAAAIFLYEPCIYQIAKDLGIFHKLFFGSDYPLLSPRRYEESLRLSGLSLKEIQGLQGENYLQLIKNLDAFKA